MSSALAGMGRGRHPGTMGIGMARLREGSLGYSWPQKSLVQQIKGKINIRSAVGVTVTISFEKRLIPG